MQVLLSHPRVHEVDEAAARRSLREQIAHLEAELLGAGAPGRPAAAGAGAALLGLPELERVRDRLAARVSDLRGAADEQGAREEQDRVLIEHMLLDPEAHRWTRVPREAIGERGCGGWHVRPRLGLIGMFMNWWRVVISSGCPLRIALAALVALLLLAAPAAAAPSRQSSSLTFSSARPGASTAVAFAVDYFDPANRGGKPYAVQRVTQTLARGARFDTSKPALCTASDAELIAAGPAACPPRSRVGGGELSLDTGAPGPQGTIDNRVDFLNNRGQLIFVFTPRGGPLAGRVVLRGEIGGRRQVTEAPPLPGAPPPDSFAAVKRVRVTLRPPRGVRGYITTPPACPVTRAWTNTIDFLYRDGVTQRVLSRSRCRRELNPCLARRSPVGPRNIGRVRLGASRRALRRLPVRPPRRLRHALSFCVKRSRGRVRAEFGRGARARLVVSTARGHGNRGVRPGRRARALARAYPNRRRLARGLFRVAPGSRRLVGVSRGRVRLVGVASRSLLRNRPALIRALRRAGLTASAR